MDGGYSTAWYNDPAEDMTTILMIQRRMWPDAPRWRTDFLTAACQAIDD